MDEYEFVPRRHTFPRSSQQALEVLPVPTVRVARPRHGPLCLAVPVPDDLEAGLPEILSHLDLLQHTRGKTRPRAEHDDEHLGARDSSARLRLPVALRL